MATGLVVLGVGDGGDDMEDGGMNGWWREKKGAWIAVIGPTWKVWVVITRSF